MVRYQSNESIRKQIEQRQLLLTKSPSSRTKTILKTQSQTMLKTNTSQYAKTKTELRLKENCLYIKKDRKILC